MTGILSTTERSEDIQREGGTEGAKELKKDVSACSVRLIDIYGQCSIPTVLQVRAWFQKDAPSSKLKSTPPIGAPKAAATPAAAPLDTKSRLSLHLHAHHGHHKTSKYITTHTHLSDLK